MDLQKDIRRFQARLKELRPQYDDAKLQLEAVNYEESFKRMHDLVKQFSLGDSGEKAIYVLAQVKAVFGIIEMWDNAILEYETTEQQKKAYQDALTRETV